jgi:hypothetical protein
MQKEQNAFLHLFCAYFDDPLRGLPADTLIGPISFKIILLAREEAAWKYADNR